MKSILVHTKQGAIELPVIDVIVLFLRGEFHGVFTDSYSANYYANLKGSNHYDAAGNFLFCEHRLEVRTVTQRQLEDLVQAWVPDTLWANLIDGGMQGLIHGE